MRHDGTIAANILDMFKKVGIHMAQERRGSPEVTAGLKTIYQNLKTRKKTAKIFSWKFKKEAINGIPRKTHYKKIHDFVTKALTKSDQPRYLQWKARDSKPIPEHLFEEHEVMIAECDENEEAARQRMIQEYMDA